MFELMIKGKNLEQKLARVRTIYSGINGIKKRIREASATLHNLLEENGGLEKDINRHLLNKERVEDPLLDYCFWHFCESLSCSDIEERRIVFDMVPEVKRFLNYVKKSKEEKVLVVQDNSQETGIISGPCQFSVEETFRYLHIPVEQLFVLNQETGSWVKEKQSLVYINPDIFQFPSNTSMEGIWVTDHYNLTYVGGIPKETFVYVGNSSVEKGLKKHFITIPARKQEVSPPPY